MSTATSRKRQTRRGTAAIALGTILIVVGGLAAAASIALIALFGTAGRLDSGPHQIASSGAAVVSDVSKIQNTRGVGAVTGWPALHLSAGGGNASGIFVGIGRSDDVDRYLAGVAVDQVTDLNLRPFELTVTRKPGSASVLAPSQQHFWVASATSGSLAELTWRVTDGSYRMVIMNADGSSNLITQAQVQIVLPNAFPLSVAALSVGVLIIGAGIVVLVVGVRRERRRDGRTLSRAGLTC